MESIFKTMKNCKIGYTIISLLLISFVFFFASYALGSSKWGFMNIEGKEVIPPQYQKIRRYSQGLAAVAINGQWGFIDHKGNFILKPKFEDASSFSENLAAVKINGKWGFVNQKGKFLIPPQFDNALPFHKGVAPVYSRTKKGWGAIDKKGVIVFPFCGAFLYPIHWNKYTIFFNHKGFWFVNKTGKNCYIPFAREINTLPPDNVPIPVLVRKEIGENAIDRWGYFQESGKWLIPPTFEEAKRFEKGYALFKKNGKWGLIDQKGDFIVQPKFEDANSFSENLAAVKLNGRWGFIDKKGNVIIQPEFDAVRSSFGTTAHLTLVQKKKKWGIIDCKRISIAISPEFDFIQEMEGNFWKIKEKNCWGIVRSNGKILAKPVYRIIEEFSENGLVAFKR